MMTVPVIISDPVIPSRQCFGVTGLLIIFVRQKKSHGMFGMCS